jgi:uncharacterized membrane protein
MTKRALATAPFLLTRAMPEAIRVLVAKARQSPAPVVIWAAINAGRLIVDPALLFLDTVIMLPVLEHARWHLHCQETRWA